MGGENNDICHIDLQLFVPMVGNFAQKNIVFCHITVKTIAFRGKNLSGVPAFPSFPGQGDGAAVGVVIGHGLRVPQHLLLEPEVLQLGRIKCKHSEPSFYRL